MDLVRFAACLPRSPFLIHGALHASTSAALLLLFAHATARKIVVAIACVMHATFALACFSSPSTIGVVIVAATALAIGVFNETEICRRALTRVTLAVGAATAAAFVRDPAARAALVATQLVLSAVDPVAPAPRVLFFVDFAAVVVFTVTAVLAG